MVIDFSTILWLREQAVFVLSHGKWRELSVLFTITVGVIFRGSDNVSGFSSQGTSFYYKSGDSGGTTCKSPYVMRYPVLSVSSAGVAKFVRPTQVDTFMGDPNSTPV